MSLRTLLIFSFFLITTSLFGQIKVPFKVRTLNKATQKKEAGVIVKVYDGATLVNTATSDASGEVNLMLDGGKRYKIEVAKAGKVTRNFTINLKNVDDELIQGATAPKGEIDMSLFDQVPNVDYSYVTSNPATEFYYDPTESQNLLYDGVLANKMVAKVEKILKDAEAQMKKGEANYNTLIKQADALYDAKKYEEAKGVYEQALMIKQTEKHPNDRLLEIEGILNAQKAANQANAQLEDEYKNLIASADALRNQKKYEEAIARYKEALSKKPEQYPKDEIAKLEAAMESEKQAAENAKQYDEAMRMADIFFNQKSWNAAKDNYTKALKFKVGDPVAKAKLEEIDKKLNEQKAQQEKKKQYEDAVAAGEALIGEEKWVEAKEKFKEALTYESAATYPKNKIKEIDDKLAVIAQEKAKKDQITKLMTEGNTALAAKKATEAKGKYEQVLALEAGHPEATAKLAEAEKLLADEKANADKIAKAKALVVEGDALAKTNKNEEAKAKYVESIALIPDPLVQAKIDAIDAKLADAAQKAEQKAKFDQLISEGDAAVTANDFTQAKTKYEDAQKIDAASTVVKQKLADLAKKMAQAEADADKAKNYSEAYSAGLTAMSNKDYAVAKEKLQLAVSIDNTKQEAKDKLSEVEKILADNAASQAKKEKYDVAVKAGTDLMAAGKLTEAKAKFEEAKTLDPTQTLPVSKIQEIEAQLARVEKEKQVNKLLADGATALAKKDLSGAKAKYNEVLQLDNSNATASEKLLEISKLENEMAGEAEKEKRFNELKAAAAGLFTQEKYVESKQKYLEAKAIKFDSDIENALKQIETKLAEQGKQAELEKQYVQVMTEAANLESAKNYDAAIAKYKDALKLKDAQEPKDHIKALTDLKNANSEAEKADVAFKAAIAKGDQLVLTKEYPAAIKAYEEAKALKPADPVPDNKIKEVERLVKEDQVTDAEIQYQKILTAGQKAMEEKNWTKAKEMYNRALNFRADDPLPKQKLQEIEDVLKKEKEGADKLASYQKKMSEAAALENSGKLKEAIDAYDQAKSIKPDETLPDTKIAQLKARLAATADAGAEMKQKYTTAMKQGEDLERGKNFEGALKSYQEALSYVPNDAIASGKVSEMKQLLDDAAKEKEKAQLYNELKAKADDLFAKSDWLNAKNAYDIMLSKFPNDEYARKQMDLCIEKARNDDFLKEYNKLIAKADEKFGEKDYERAKELYTRALGIMSNDPYPKKKLKEIEDALNPPKTTIANNTNPEGEELVLQPLGTAVDNSVEDNEERLQNANKLRKGRNSTRFFKRSQKTNEKTGELSEVQQERAVQASESLDSVRNTNTTQTDGFDDKRQENVKVVKAKDEQITSDQETLQQIKTLNIQEQKNQIVAANRTVDDQNAVLDGSAAENEAIIKQKKENLNKTDEKLDDSNTEEVRSNDQELATVKIKIEENTTDDFNERKAEEEKVKEQVNLISDDTQQRDVLENEEGYEVKMKIAEVESKQIVKNSDEVKQSPLNEEKIKAIEADQVAQTEQEDQEKMENTDIMVNKIRNDEEKLTEFGEKRTEDQQKNKAYIHTTEMSYEEKQRQGFNTNYEKDIANKQVLVEQTAILDEYQDLPSIAAEKNVSVYNSIKEEENGQKELRGQELTDKTLNNTNKLTLIKEENSEKDSDEQKKNLGNAETLKSIQAEIGVTDKANSESQKEKTQANTQAIREEVSKENNTPEKSGKYEVDTAKYLEGVNQEVFENYDKEGLLINIITRRIVVKGGRGDVYVKTQSIDQVTYTKNGEPCTEYTWIKETQNAQLIKHF